MEKMEKINQMNLMILMEMMEMMNSIVMSRLVSIASAPDSKISGDKLKCSAKKSPIYSKLGYRKH
jgi:hypothetical protein